MPTYEYECPACGNTFERFQSITAEPVRTCPECGGRKVRRLLGAGAGIIFRGSGFYQTDYRSADYKRKAKAENGNGSGSKSTASSDTKNKAAAKSDS
jgi:putative FmdB family regulatory protein